jgi:hypothetical protein
MVCIAVFIAMTGLATQCETTLKSETLYSVLLIAMLAVKKLAKSIQICVQEVVCARVSWYEETTAG